MTDEYIDRVFGPDGMIASKFCEANPGSRYEIREGQIELARRIDEAFSTGKHLIGEGPCGTGKSLAYCVPGVWHALKGKTCHSEETQSRVIVATGNIALQEQLVNKDLPFLQSVLPSPFRFALLKGRNNFVCKERFQENQAKGRLPGGLTMFNDSFDRELIRIVDWIDGSKTQKPTTTGDRSDLHFVPKDKHWNMVAVGSNDCRGKSCKSFDDCFSRKAKARAGEADIVVTNFHMLFAHVQVKRQTEGFAFVLPEFKFLIIDEAHDLPDVARSFFGFDRGAGGIKEMTNLLREWGAHSESVELEAATNHFFDAVEDFGRSERYPGKLIAGSLESEVDFVRLENALRSFCVLAEQKLEGHNALCDECKGTGEKKHDGELLASEIKLCSRCAGSGSVMIELDHQQKKRVMNSNARALNISHEITESLYCTGSPGRVYYLETAKGRPPKICARTIDVAEVISSELMSETYSTVLVSATLSENGDFSFSKRENGLHLHEPIEVIASSPFNFERQALLVCPPGPEPNSYEEFSEHCANAFEIIVKHFKGRTLGLFTSYKNLNAVAERLRPIVSDLLVQGDHPRSELRRQFKERTESVLLGTSSFWTGIDVPGESLSAVVIDKLPFPNRSDPIVSAIDEMDPNSFQNYMVPRAAIHLRQGAGRLIRSKTDTGVIVILDSRIEAKRYGRRFKRSLPPMMITSQLEHIPLFMAEANQWAGRGGDHAAASPPPPLDDSDIPF